MPFVELDREIERASGMELSEIFATHGQAMFRRLERQCLETIVERFDRVVIATGGSLVTEPATYDLLLSTCFVVWLSATPDEHMGRVLAQGDLRPMADGPQAMDDLKAILESRTPLYAKADAEVSTSGKTEAQAFAALLRQPIAQRQARPCGGAALKLSSSAVVRTVASSSARLMHQADLRSSSERSAWHSDEPRAVTTCRRSYARRRPGKPLSDAVMHPTGTGLYAQGPCPTALITLIVQHVPCQVQYACVVRGESSAQGGEHPGYRSVPQPMRNPSATCRRAALSARLRSTSRTMSRMMALSWKSLGV